MREYDNYQMLHEVLSAHQMLRATQLKRALGSRFQKIAPGVKKISGSSIQKTNPKFYRQLTNLRKVGPRLKQAASPEQAKNLSLGIHVT